MRRKEKFSSVIVDHPWLVILASLIVFLSCSLGLQHLEMDPAADALMDDDYPGKIEHNQVLDDFTDSTNLQILVVGNKGGDTEKSAIFSVEGLTLLRELSDEAWQIPYASRVDSLANYQHTEALGDDLSVADLVPLDIELDHGRVQRVRDIALSAVSLKGQLVAINGDMAVVNVEFEVPDAQNRGEVYEEVITFMDSLLAGYRSSYADYEFHNSGTVTSERAMSYYANQDSTTLIPMMLILIVIALWFLLRSAVITLAATIVVVITGMTSMGLLGWLGIKLDTLSYVAPIVIMTLAVADVIHLSLGVIGGKREGKTKLDSIAYGMDLNTWPIFLTSLTTALGVITFSLSDYPPLRSMGLAIVVGVTMAFVFTLTLLPALLTQLPINASGHRISSAFARMATWVNRHFRKILLVGGTVCAFFVFSASLNTLNESPEIFFKLSTPERQSIELLKREMNGTNRFDVAIYTDQSEGAMQVGFMQDIADLNEWLMAQQGVSHVSSITDTIKRLNKSMHGDAGEYYALPESQALTSQYLLLYELSLPYGLDLANQLNYDKSATRLIVSTKGLFAAETVELKREIASWFEQRNPDVRVAFAGYTMVMQELAINHLMPSLAKGGGIAFLLISIILMLVFKDWRYGLVCVCANLVPVAMGYGFWAYLSGLANFAVMCVAGICLGVVIDFAVHFLSKYRFARQQEKSPDAAVHYAFNKVALPIGVTTIALVGGFWVLALSPVSLNAGMGLLTGIIIILAFLFDMLMLPAMLLWFERKRAK